MRAMKTKIFAWLLSLGYPNKSEWAEAIEKVATTEFDAALLVTIGHFETGFDNSKLGDKGSSVCAYQISKVNLPSVEGWTAKDLQDSPMKCATVALRIIKISEKRCGAKALLNLYNSGSCAKGQAITNQRLYFAKGLLQK